MQVRFDDKDLALDILRRVVVANKEAFEVLAFRRGQSKRAMAMLETGNRKKTPKGTKVRKASGKAAKALALNSVKNSKRKAR